MCGATPSPQVDRSVDPTNQPPFPSRTVLHGSGKDLKDAPRIKLHWVGKKGEGIETDGIVGESILEAAHRHEIDLEGGLFCAFE